LGSHDAARAQSEGRRCPHHLPFSLWYCNRPQPQRVSLRGVDVVIVFQCLLNHFPSHGCNQLCIRCPFCSGVSTLGASADRELVLVLVLDGGLRNDVDEFSLARNPPRLLQTSIGTGRPLIWQKIQFRNLDRVRKRSSRTSRRDLQLDVDKSASVRKQSFEQRYHDACCRQFRRRLFLGSQH
jgi:hypothetical protein